MPLAKSYAKSALQSPTTIGRSRTPHAFAREWNARSRARASSQSSGPARWRMSLWPKETRWSTASVVPSCWSSETVRKVGSRSGLTTRTGTPIEILRSAAIEDERGAITHSASTPCVVRLSTASCGEIPSPSPRLIELTAYPAARAVDSRARSVLVGPNSTALSTITPMRWLFCVASARAAMLGR
nr:hypothetical protein GCM10025732_32820 [Glycomyces mayteni]